MYALVINNEIVKVFANPEGFTLNDNQYSSQIFTAWSKEEKQAIGIYEVETDSTNLKDESYYNNTNEVFEFKRNLDETKINKYNTNEEYILKTYDKFNLDWKKTIIGVIYWIFGKKKNE